MKRPGSCIKRDCQINEQRHFAAVASRYAKLDEVQEGGMPQSAYLEAIDPQTTPERREKLVNALREYCKLDTLAMVKIARFF